MVKLFSCDWIRDGNNLIITGPTRTGKTFIACALAQKACRQGYTVQYIRYPESFGNPISLKVTEDMGKSCKIMTNKTPPT